MASYGDFLLSQAPTPAQDLQLADSGSSGPDWYSMLMPGDQFDTAKMQGNTAGDGAAPWWEDLIKYGATRIIDNTTGPSNTQGNTSPGSFAGTNGKTYPQDVAKQTTAVQQQQSGMGMLLMIGLGYMLLKG